MGRYGQVSLELVDEAGTPYSVTRTYDPPGGNPYADDDQELTANGFPILFLSQNEIVRIAESDEEQLLLHR